MIKEEMYKLRNGVFIPKIGFGTWQAKDGEEAYHAVRWALEAGYQHIDTAYAYENEGSVAKAIKDAGADREQLFITTKLPSHIKSYKETLEYFDQSRKNLDTDYVDLYLIHAPWPWSNIGQDCRKGNIEAWKAMIELYEQKKIRSIGVSNFLPEDIDNIVKASEFVPHANQIRFFIGNIQKSVTSYCQERDILVEAYSPMATGNLLQNGTILAMAEKYKVSVPQLCIRFCLECNTLPLPKSVHENRIWDNLKVDFTISKEDMEYLLSLVNEELRRDLRS